MLPIGGGTEGAKGKEPSKKGLQSNPFSAGVKSGGNRPFGFFHCGKALDMTGFLVQRLHCGEYLDTSRMVSKLPL